MLQPRAALLSVSVAASLALGTALPASTTSSTTITNNSADELHFVMISADGNNSMTVNGDRDDYHRAEALRSGNQGILYVRQKGVAYVIRDAEMLRRADALMEPQRAMGARQAALGAQQAALGERQGALGAQQGRLGAQMADSTPRQMAELGRQQGELGRSQAALGEQQAELGRKQGDLGREQGRLASIATANMRKLVADAIQRGLAQRVN